MGNHFSIRRYCNQPEASVPYLRKTNMSEKYFDKSQREQNLANKNYFTCPCKSTIT